MLQQEQKIFELHNIARIAAGLPVLKRNATLDKIAKLRSQEMANLNYFSHDSPSGEGAFMLMKEFGYTFSWAGENIAAISGTNDFADRIMNLWMNSPGHKANILNEHYTSVGIGVAKSSKADYEYYITAVFANP